MDVESKSEVSSPELDGRSEDHQQFLDRLEGFPIELAQTIAVRCALRALPLIERDWDHLVKQKVTPPNRIVLPIFRAVSTAWAARISPISESPITVASADVAHTASIAAADAASSIAFTAATSASDAARANTYGGANKMLSANSANAAVLTAAAAAAADAAPVSTDAAAVRAAAKATEEMWGAANFDIDYFEVKFDGRREIAATKLSLSPVWGEKTPPWFKSSWDALKARLLDKDENWSVWTDWYEARINGTHTNEALEIARATISEKLWEQSVPRHLKHFKSLERQHGPLILEGAEQGGDDPSEVEPSDPVDAESESDTPTVLPSETNMSAVVDTPARDHDRLGRSRAAFILAGQIQQVWEERRHLDRPKFTHPMARWRNWFQSTPTDPQAGFVVHIDAPWGGGKTSFANYLAMILNPPSDEASRPQWLKDLGRQTGNKSTEPWHTVQFNAWQHQHITPPWWTFYESIRKQLVRSESWNQRIRHWLNERLWRLLTPHMIERLVISAAVIALLYLLYSYGWTSTDDKGKVSIAPPDMTTAIGTIATALLGGGTMLWAFMSGIYKSLLPGTPEAAKNYSLGTSDPLERFRAHFRRFMVRFDRPVLVVVDDLDRCDPAYVVDLVRGMQTILQSPHIFFVLLGDRDWIEQAFTDQNKAMKDIDVGGQHEFGARFVEKAIQLAFVLPDIDLESQRAYVRSVLGRNDPEQKQEETQEESDLVADIEVELNEIRKTKGVTERETRAAELKERVSKSDIDDQRKTTLNQEVEVTTVLSTASDSGSRSESEEIIERQLVGIAGLMPANPRQIIRIINTLALVQGVARLEESNASGKKDFRTGAEHWQLLARWIVLMIEWPKTWFTLSKHPSLINHIHGTSGGSGEGLLENYQALAEKIKSDDNAHALLDFNTAYAKQQLGDSSNWSSSQIDLEALKWLVNIIPPTSGAVLKTAPPKEEPKS